MAARNLAPVRALVRELVPITGSFAPNGSSAVDATSNKGLGWTVVRTSTGLFTITFADKWSDLVSFTTGLQLATGDDKFLQTGAYDASARTITIRVWDVSGGAVADISANANNRISFTAWFRNSAALPVHD